MRPFVTPLFALAALVACSAPGEAEIAPTPSADVTGTLFVANKRGASLSRIDLASGAETHRADTCENPHELTVSPDEAHVLVACYSGASVEIYATADLAPVRTIELGDNARVHSAIWHADGRLHAASEGRGSLFVIDDPLAEELEMTEIPGGEDGPHMVAVNEADTFAFGTIIPTGTVVRWDVASLEETTRRTLGGQIEALALSPDGSSLWVGSNADARVYRLDAETLETQAEVETGPRPIRLAMHPSGEFVVTSNFDSGDLTVIDTASGAVARTISVSGSSDARQVTLVFTKNGERLYAAETQANAIAEIDFASGKVLRRLPTGPGGDGLAVIE